jgi:4-amino-4-deoxy-L-arabinose transferase-like glycosyltransferase
MVSASAGLRSGRGTPVSTPARPPLWRGAVFGIAGCFVVLELVVSARYGFHRDELYFLACARHMAWGYVDQPPFVPAVAWLASHIAGGSVVALRTLPALAGGTAVVLTALMARELGGGRKAQFVAALAAATSPLFVASFHLLSTAAFDEFFWAAITFFTLRLLRTGDERLWLVIGGLAGVGLLNKLNVAFLLAALAAGFLIDGRARQWWSRWLWAGAGLAILLWLPNVIWNAQHDWAAVAMLRSLHHENSTLGASIGFIPAQLIVVGPVLAVLWLAGLRRLFNPGFARPLAVAYVVLLIFFAVTGGKPYYLAGLYFLLFASGAVWAEERLDRRLSRRGLRGWAALMMAGCLLALPLALPVLPQSAQARGSSGGNINKDLSATIGWRAFVQQVARISASLPADERAQLVVFAGDYGAAGAIDQYGSNYGLPATISGHNSYWWWGPGRASDGATTIAVDLPKTYLLTIFTQVIPAGVVATPGGVWTEERGDPIWICRGQRLTWAQAWPAARHYG